jgi:hypothetical protein
MRLSTVSTCLACLLFSIDASAQDGGKGNWGEFSVLIAGEITAATLGLGGVVTTVGNSVYLTRGEPAPGVWHGLGYTFGVLNVVAAIAFLTSDTRTGAWFSMAHATVGVADIGLTLWGHMYNHDQRPQIVLVPLVLPDQKRGTCLGLSLSLGAF